MDKREKNYSNISLVYKKNYIYNLYTQVFSSFPIRASIDCVWMVVFALCPDQFFLRSFLLVSFLGIVARRPRGSGSSDRKLFLFLT